MASTKKPRNDNEWFVQEFALAQVALQISQAMEERGVSQRELAARLGVHEVRVSQMLGADKNMTVRTLARIAHALDCGLAITFKGPAVRAPKGGKP